MDTKERLIKREDKVKAILEYYPEARDDDRFLTLIYHNVFCNVDYQTPYITVMLDKELPSQESIGRCRRKLQEKNESLRGSKAKEQIRMAEQEGYIEYATEGGANDGK